MSIKLRYRLVEVGCVAHAIYLLASFFYQGIDNIMPHTLRFQVWMILACLWPVWGFLLWFFGQHQKGAVALPMIAGLIVLVPVFEVIGVRILFSGGAGP
jgi:hypothetical protein